MAERIKRKLKDENASLMRQAIRDYPRYNEFEGTDFIGIDGTEWKLPWGKYLDKMISNKETYKSGLNNPPQKENNYYGKQKFFWRIPSATQKETNPPVVNEVVTLYHLKTQVLCTARVDEEYHLPYQVTGKAVLKNVQSLGQVSDAEPYEKMRKDNLKNFTPKRKW